MPEKSAAAAVTQPVTTLSTQDRSALWAVMMAVALSTLDSTITNTALPRIAAGLQAQPATAIWVINAYQLEIGRAHV